MRQRLRAWYYEVPRQRGATRPALRVETCFRLLLGWVVSWWHGTHLALAVDATAWGTRFVVLAVSVVYRGGAIPVAWVELPANTKHAWRREWLRLVRRLRPVSVLRHGWVALLWALLRQEPLPEGRLVPRPWPAVPAWKDETCEPQRALPEAA